MRTTQRLTAYLNVLRPITFCFGLCALTLGLALGGTAHAASPNANEIINTDCPDVTVMRRGNDYFLSGTIQWDGFYHLYHSTDLIHWNRIGRVFDTPPAWVNPSDPAMWGPNLRYNDVTKLYYCFYSAREIGGVSGTPLNCALGAATAPSPLGPWTDRGMLYSGGGVDGHALDDGSVIDACLFLDEDGQAWLSWEEELYGRHIGLGKLSQDWLTLDTASLQVVYRPSATWEKGITEGMGIVKFQGHYIMVYSGGGYTWQGGYAVGVLTASSMEGPWTVYAQNPILATTSLVNAPGSGESPFMLEDGTWWYAHHGLLTSRGASWTRSVFLDRFSWNNSGIPAPQHINQWIPATRPQTGPRNLLVYGDFECGDQNFAPWTTSNGARVEQESGSVASGLSGYSGAAALVHASSDYAGLISWYGSMWNVPGAPLGATLKARVKMLPAFKGDTDASDPLRLFMWDDTGNFQGDAQSHEVACDGQWHELTQAVTLPLNSGFNLWLRIDAPQGASDPVRFLVDDLRLEGVATTGAASDTNLLTNGDFEQWSAGFPTGWTCAGATSVAASSAGEGEEGLGAMLSAPAGFQALEQTIAWAQTEDRYVVFDVWLKGMAGSVASPAFLQIDAAGSDGGSGNRYTLNPSATPVNQLSLKGYKRFSAAARVQGGATALTVRIAGAQSSGTFQCMVDSARLRVAEPYELFNGDMENLDQDGLPSNMMSAETGGLLASTAKTSKNYHGRLSGQAVLNSVLEQPLAYLPTGDYTLSATITSSGAPVLLGVKTQSGLTIDSVQTTQAQPTRLTLNFTKTTGQGQGVKIFASLPAGYTGSTGTIDDIILTPVFTAQAEIEGGTVAGYVPLRYSAQASEYFYYHTLEGIGQDAYFPPVTAPSADVYEVNLCYATAFGSAPLQLELWVNGTQQGLVQAPATADYSDFALANFNLELEEGDNFIVLKYPSSSTTSVSIDSLSLIRPPQTAVNLSAWHIE